MTLVFFPGCLQFFPEIFVIDFTCSLIALPGISMLAIGCHKFFLLLIFNEIKKSIGLKVIPY